MWMNHLRVAFRTVRKHKGYGIINVAGLSMGMACTILILLWIQDELSYDRFHTKADRIFRIVFSTSDDGMPTNANGSFGVGPALKRDFPEVVETARIRKMGQGVTRYVGYGEKKFYESLFFFAEPTLFSVFDFPLIQGDPAKALAEPNTVVITESMARKYFGKENPIGKTLETDPYNDGELMFFRVTGIAKDPPHPSHLHFDFLASYCSQREDTDRFSGFYQHFTYVLLNRGRSARSLENKLPEFLHRRWREDPWYTLHLQPLLDIHLRSGLKSEIEPNGNILYVHVFFAVALLVLIIACINFMNLATARAARRAREVGIRKAMGAKRKQLIGQFLGESILLGVLSGAVAVAAVTFLLPAFNSLTGKALSPSLLTTPLFLMATAAIALAVGILSGIYPAFFLSAFHPMGTLRQDTTHTASGAVLRRALVVFQFALSIAIIVATLVVHHQMDHIRSRPLGYDKEQIMAVPLNKTLRQNFAAFRDELMKNPAIENITTSSLVPTRGSYHMALDFEGLDERLSQVVYLVDREFLDTYGLKLLAGKKKQQPIAKGKSFEYLVSERTLDEAGYASPQEAIGKLVNLEGDRGHIVGVVKDINIYSLHRPSYAICYLVTSIADHNYISIRVRPRDLSSTLDTIRNTWQRMVPDYPLDYFFLDASFAQLHSAEQKMSKVFSIFSVLAIVVACLGLFGLAAHTAADKTKEIGIRKVLGASVSSLYLLLTREFLRWVALATLIAWPAAYIVMQRWLQNFFYRITIGWEAFAAAAGVALVVSLLTVSYQSIKAAIANPVDSLRYE